MIEQLLAAYLNAIATVLIVIAMFPAPIALISLAIDRFGTGQSSKSR